MYNSSLKTFFLLGLFLSGIGLLVLFLSIKWGTEIAENWLIKSGGADITQYNIVTESYINIFITIGGIVFAVGAVTTMMSVYKSLLLEMNSKKEMTED